MIGNQAIGGSGSNTFAFGGGINNTSATLDVMGSSFFGNKALALSPAESPWAAASRMVPSLALGIWT